MAMTGRRWRAERGAGPRGDRRIAVCTVATLFFVTVRVFDYPWMAGAPQAQEHGSGARNLERLRI